MLVFLIGEMVRLLLAPNTTGPHGLFGGEFGDRKADRTGNGPPLFSLPFALFSPFSKFSLSLPPGDLLSSSSLHVAFLLGVLTFRN